MRRTRIVASFGIVILYILHNNFWSWQPDPTLILGRFPVDLVYRLLWVGASAGVLWLVVRGWWGPSE